MAPVVEGQGLQKESQQQGDEQPWFLRSSYPVLFPSHPALTKPRSEFDSFLSNELQHCHGTASDEGPAVSDATKDLKALTDAETFTLVSAATSVEIKEALAAMDIDPPETNTAAASEQDNKVDSPNDSSFMQGLVNYGKPKETAPVDVDTENKMLTENADVAYRSTTDPLVDLFAELEDVVSGPRLRELLDAAWATDSLATLKIIFNARSIHLGKSSRHTFYRAAGWLAQNHPHTLVANIQWLSRPVIQKTVNKEGEDDDLVIVEAEADHQDPHRFDVKNGVAHGYWKDLLNILALAVNDKLNVLASPRDILNVEHEAFMKPSRHRRMRNAGIIARDPGLTSTSGPSQAGDEHTTEEKTVRVIGNRKDFKRLVRDNRHKAAIEAFNNNAVYRALHLAVARLFAEQLQADIAAIRGSDDKAKRTVSLCGKWAPSQDHFHDRHTFVISSIAEIMYPRESFDHVPSATDDRETYLRHARERYRKDVSALRKHLEVVERDITAKSFAKINYERVPSLAMRNYSGLFIEKDLNHFNRYIEQVAEGQVKISGATLLPSTLVHSVMLRWYQQPDEEGLQSWSHQDMLKHKVRQIEAKVDDGQWKTLVQRIKDSGTLSSSIAVCDVSGSMSSPQFADGTNPMDSAIGLSLLVAEVTEPPFGGAFITFHSHPEVQRIDLSKSLMEKARQISQSPWGQNTNFAAVFERLILPMAIENNLRQEDMVKRVFVFSDMQFDAAERSWNSGNACEPWSSSFERIKQLYTDAGYEMPELVFWNLAGGRAGYGGGSGGGDPTAPKPVTAGEAGTALVSGYSQGMLKTFMDNGCFENPDEEEKGEKDDGNGAKDEDEGGDGAESGQKKSDPLMMVKRAIGHKAYSMLKVLD